MSDLVAPTEAVAKIPPKKPRKPAKQVDKQNPASPPDTAKPAKSSPDKAPSSQPSTNYNWLLSSHAIQVPGGPPKWTPPPLPYTLPPDSGRQFVDQNASRVPKYPFEPAFRAMAVMAPDAKLNDVAIVVNRNSLRKFLDFAGGKRGDPWRMGLCMVHDTLFITRNERTASMMIHGRAGAGYGHSFEKEFTTAGEGLQASSSHHRVLRYQLGSLHCLVRFEVDAWLDDRADEPQAVMQHLTETVDSMRIEASAPAKPRRCHPKTAEVHHPKKKGTSETQILLGGSLTPPSHLAELKTLSSSSSSISSKTLSSTPQLWFGRTPYLLTGVHSSGVVSRTTLVNVAATFANWEDANQERLGKMVGLLEVLRGVVGGMPGGRREAVLVYERRGGELRVVERRGGLGGVLPGDMVERFWG